MESEVGLTASPVGISRGTGCRTKEVVSDDCSCSSSVGIGLDLKYCLDTTLLVIGCCLLHFLALS